MYLMPYSLNFKANDDNANFDNRNLNANDNYSAGVVLLGLCLNKKELLAMELFVLE